MKRAGRSGAGLPGWWWRAAALPLLLMLLFDFIGLLFGLSPLDHMEGRLFDFRTIILSFSGHTDLSPVSLMVKDKSSDDMLKLSPWPRTVYARAIDYVGHSSKPVVALDFLFDTVSSDDAGLARSIAGEGSVVLASRLYTDEDPGTRCLTEPVRLLNFAAAANGIINFLPDSTGVVRSVPLYRNHPVFRNRPVPSIVLSSYLLWLIRGAWHEPDVGKASVALQSLVDEVAEISGSKESYNLFDEVEPGELKTWKAFVDALKECLGESPAAASFEDPVIENLFREYSVRVLLRRLCGSVVFPQRWSGDEDLSAGAFIHSRRVLDAVARVVGRFLNTDSACLNLKGPDLVVDFSLLGAVKGIAAQPLVGFGKGCSPWFRSADIRKREIQIRLLGPGDKSISGRVTNLAGNGIAGVKLLFLAPSGRWARAVSGPDGAFLLNGLGAVTGTIIATRGSCRFEGRVTPGLDTSCYNIPLPEGSAGISLPERALGRYCLYAPMLFPRWRVKQGGQFRIPLFQERCTLDVTVESTGGDGAKSMSYGHLSADLGGTRGRAQWSAVYSPFLPEGKRIRVEDASGRLRVEYSLLKDEKGRWFFVGRPVLLGDSFTGTTAFSLRLGVDGCSWSYRAFGEGPFKGLVPGDYELYALSAGRNAFSSDTAVSSLSTAGQPIAVSVKAAEVVTVAELPSDVLTPKSSDPSQVPANTVFSGRVSFPAELADDCRLTVIDYFHPGVESAASLKVEIDASTSSAVTAGYASRDFTMDLTSSGLVALLASSEDGKYRAVYSPSTGAEQSSVVLMGTTLQADQDFYPTPLGSWLGRALSGVEIHAAGLLSLMKKSFFSRPSAFVRLLCVLIPFFAVIPAFTLLSPEKAAVIWAVIIAGYIGASIWVAYSLRLWIPMARPIALLLLAPGAFLAYRAIDERRESARRKEIFGKFVSPKMVSRLLELDEVSLGGERRELTVLFSDIRSFTTLSEVHDPRDISGMLAEYFNRMMPVLHKYDGTLDKFIGDAVMAFFGAPEDQPNHARRAVAVALEMLAENKKLSRDRQSRGDRAWPPFDIGFGIATGECYVGLVGSDEVFNYSVIGDTVNLASRLEGLNKTFKSEILISERTYKYVEDMVEVQLLDSVDVKGKREKVRVYRVFDFKEGRFDPFMI